MNFDKIIDGMRDDIIKATQRTIRNKSVKTDKINDFPFGEDIHKCFIDFLKMGEELDFDTLNVDNYSGHIEMGEGEEIVGVLAHLDVVPEGDYWTYPPYGAEIHDNKIYGRGTIDDKGPAVATLFAMKAIRDSGVKLNKKVRLILGLDEESGSTGISHYLTKQPNPNTGFTPDADFPVIHGEKGILTVDLVKDLEATDAEGITLIDIQGGNKSNMVPDYCVAKLSNNIDINPLLKDYLTKNSVDISITEEDNAYILTAKGISAHGSTPEKGVNAISILIDFLSKLTFADKNVTDFINLYIDKINNEVNGVSMGCGFSDKESGELTFNAGVLSIKDNSIVLTCNLRYPVTTKKECILEGIDQVIKGYEVKQLEISHAGPLYVPKDAPLVKQLIEAYEAYIPGDHEPITIGGGTYARSCDNILAFGAVLPHMEELAHQKDEYIGVDDLITITKIFAKAIYLLSL